MAIRTDPKTGLPTTIPAANASGTTTGTKPGGIAPPSGVETKTGFMAPVETVSAGAVQPGPSSMIGNNVSTDPLLTGKPPKKPEAVTAMPTPVPAVPGATAPAPQSAQYDYASANGWAGTTQAVTGGSVTPPATAAEMPAAVAPGTQQNADIESTIKSIDPTGSMTDEEKNQIRASLLKYEKSTVEEMAKNARDVLQASRLQRDVTQRLKYDQTQYDLQTAQQIQQFDSAISAQKDRMAADQNNLGIALSTSGRLQSQRAMASAQSVLDRNRQVYQDMLSTRDNVLAQMANQLQFSQKQISDEFNDSISQSMQDKLNKINALDKTGAMNSAAWLIQARDYIDAVNSEYLQYTDSYVNKLTALYTMYTEQAKAHKEANAFSKDITESMNDGYLYTSGGIRMTDDSGGYLKNPEGAYWTPLTKEPQKTDDGRYFMAYQQPDGTVKTVMLSGTEVATPADEIIQSYGRMIADKTISADMIKGMSQATRDKVMQAAAAYAETKPEEVKASDFLKLEDADGNSYYFNPKTRQSVTPEQFAASAARPEGLKAGGTLDFTGMADKHPGEASFKNNNPAGITWHAASQGLKDAWEAAGINFEIGTSRPSKEGGNYVKFATVVDGINAREIAMERKGGTVTDALKQWVGTTNAANNAAYASSIVKAAGIDGNKTYAQLTDGEKEALSIAQLRREAGGMYQEMVNRGYITDQGFDYGKMESDSGAVEGTQAEAPVDNQYTDIARDIIDKTIKSSDLKSLGYKPSEIKKIEAERVRLSSQSGEGNLSTAAQRAVGSKSITETGKEKTAVLNELQEAGVFDKGEGNQNYYEAKPDVKAEFPSFFSARDSFAEAKRIIEKHRASGDLDEFLGSYDTAQQRMKSKTGAFFDDEFQRDFDKLDNLLSKELSQYMKNISGATVSEKEAERLQRQIPNLDMSETQFDEAIDAYETALKNAQRYFVNHYGFNDEATARKTILGESSAPSAQGQGRWNPNR